MIIREDIYQTIKQIMPIPCVDVMVTDAEYRLLLVKRKNEPARDMWWFPGGRVHYGETRQEAAIRKLYEECGLEANSIEELGTHDVMLDVPGQAMSHGITTVYHITLIQTDNLNLQLDSQSQQACWLSRQQWLQKDLHPFIKQMLHIIELP